jgi:CPA1 family monovalent cation:H+ antiporter
MVWSQIDITKAHVAYAVVAVFSTIFSLCSLFVKEKLYLGEASVATIYGLIVGPHCLDWFNPLSWGNYFYITLEISRVLLCIEIVAVSVELPKKYVLNHWFPLFLLLIPCMTAGWLIIGAFVYAIIPGLTFSYGLLISACVTATDPILAQAVVGKGKFAKRVPAHLRNLLSAESACNDGISVPFVYLALNLILHHGNANEIAKDWICVTVLYECVFGCILGTIIGFLGRKSLRYAEDHDLIDHESFLAFYIMLAMLCAGFGSILGVDDLLASFAAGTAFAWDGWFTHRTEESNVSTVIDILLNMAYFVYFGAIIPWEEFNDTSLGLDCWRLICLAIVVLFLRRIPAVLLTKSINPDIKNWKEALFVGHFGPIGVGAVFAAILAISDLEADVLNITHGPTTNYPTESEYYRLIRIIWPTVSFLIITSILIHGSSVAVLTLGRQLQSMTFTMTLTKGETDTTTSNWFNRLPKLERSGTSFSLKRIDTLANQDQQDYEDILALSNTSNEEYSDEKLNAKINAGIGMERFQTLSNNPTIETTGKPVRPIGVATRKKKRRLLKSKKSKNRKQPPIVETLDLKTVNRHGNTSANEENNEELNEKDEVNENKNENENESIKSIDDQFGDMSVDDKNKLTVPLQKIISNASKHSDSSNPDLDIDMNELHGVVHATPEVLRKVASNYELSDSDLKPVYDKDGDLRIPTQAYNYDDSLVIEDQHGEILRTVHSRASTATSETSQDHSLKEKASSFTKRIATTIGLLPQPSHHSDHDGSSDSSLHHTKSISPRNDSIGKILEDDDMKNKFTKNDEKLRDERKQSSSKSAFKKIVGISDNFLLKNRVPRKTKTLHGFRVNDDIIIENEDGEILGRYKVNVKKQKAEELAKGIDDKEYNDNLINKTLTYFGLKKQREEIDEELNQLGNSDLIPESNDITDLGIEDKIKHFINADPRKAVVSLPSHLYKVKQHNNMTSTNTKNSKSITKNNTILPSVLIHDSDSDSEYLSDDESYDSSDEHGSSIDSDENTNRRGTISNIRKKKTNLEQSLYEESKYEKARRTAALDRSKRQSDDEEE